MNKLVLEKLLHLYKLVPEKTNVDLEILLMLLYCQNGKQKKLLWKNTAQKRI